MDYSAIESAYNATQPPDAEVFANVREKDESYKVWWVVWQRTSGLLLEPWLMLETMPNRVGFSALEVDQVIQFGTQGQGLILTGSFDAAAIRTAYQANLGLAQQDLDGMAVWCWAEDCSGGAQIDSEYRMQENPFGGNLGQRQPMIISNDLLMAAADLELVLAHLGAAEGTVPNLADDPDHLAAVNAVSQGPDVLQAVITNPTIAQRMANRLPIDERLSVEIHMAAQAEFEAIQVGTLTGVNASMDLAALQDGVIDEVNFGGIVIVELDDGTTVEAIWDRSLGDQFVGGMKLLVAPTSDPDFWKVLRIMEIP